jgi:hypothetical protein
MRFARFAIALTVLCTLTAADSGDFSLTTFKGFERNQIAPESVQGYNIDAARPGLAVVVSHECAVREIPEDKRLFLQGLGKVFNKPDILSMYRRELRVMERDREYWIPFQEPTIDQLLGTACEIPEISIRVRYMGVHRELGRIYLGIGFDGRKMERPDRMSCLANELHGVSIGEPLGAVRKRLTELYGVEHAVPQRGEIRHYAYGVDSKHRTTMIIGDAGDGPRERVFSVQISGPPNPVLELPAGLHLGDSPEKIAAAFGTPEATVNSGDGFQMLKYANSPCSVEIKDGVLASVLIMGDPNYFDE